MKKVLLYAIAVLALTAQGTISDAEFERLAKKKGKTEAERIAFRDYIVQQENKKYGGMVTKPNSSKGRIVIVNSQNEVPLDVLTEALEQFKLSLRVDFEVQSYYGMPVLPTDARSKFNANAVIVVKNEEPQATLAVFPDQNYAEINLRPLFNVAPTNEISRARVQKELIRAVAYVCGAASSPRPESLTGNISSLKDLDAIPNHQLPPDIVKRLQTHLPQMGVTPVTRATYLKACQEGWAPAPTNDIQRAIWNEVRKLPTKPIKIEFDPAKGK